MTIALGEARIPDGMRVYAIGDVHGCLNELRQMVAAIDRDLMEKPVGRHRIIYIGDYVDRGPDSAGVIDYLINANDSDYVTCLKGNHEDMFLRFLADPHSSAEISLRNGIRETLASYGLDTEGDDNDDAIAQFADRIDDLIPADHRKFLHELPSCTDEGDFFFCHAGIRPGTPLEQQDDHDLIWIRSPFLNTPDLFEKVVVHGHTPQREVEIFRNRINIDTSCVYGGELTAVVLEGTVYRFIQAERQ